MNLIGKGAEADIFSSKIFGRETIIKVRNPKRYRIRELDIGLRKTRTKKEAKAMYKASKVGVRVPRLYAIGKFSIYMERLEGKLLKDSGAMPKTFRVLGGILGVMHKAGITHGDFTPANVMINKNIIYIIDFGLSEITKNIEEKALDLLLMKRSISQTNYNSLVRAYKIRYVEAQKVIERLSEIEKRGRYQIRTLV